MPFCPVCPWDGGVCPCDDCAGSGIRKCLYVLCLMFFVPLSNRTLRESHCWYATCMLIDLGSGKTRLEGTLPACLSTLRLHVLSIPGAVHNASNSKRMWGDIPPGLAWKIKGHNTSCFLRKAWTEVLTPALTCSKPALYC